MAIKQATIRIEEELRYRMKIRAAQERMNITQYIAWIAEKDIKEYEEKNK